MTESIDIAMIMFTSQGGPVKEEEKDTKDDQLRQACVN